MFELAFRIARLMHCFVAFARGILRGHRNHTVIGKANLIGGFDKLRDLYNAKGLLVNKGSM